MLVRKNQNSERDLIIMKAHKGPTEKKVKYQSNIFMNIMANTVIIELIIASSHFINIVKRTYSLETQT